MAGSPERIQVRALRSVYAFVLAVGLGGLALAAAFEDFRAPFMLFVFGTATLLGLVGVLDRRIKLELSAEGFRHARWGPNVIPRTEFSGFRATVWRNNVYLQLIPRHQSYVLERFSPLGRLNQRCARLVGQPTFSIAVTPLAVAEKHLVSALGRHLPLFR